MPQPTKNQKPSKQNKKPANADRTQKRPSTPSRQQSSSASTPPDPTLSTLLASQSALLKPSPEQHLLNTITSALSEFTSDTSYAEKLQTIKQLFYNRDYKAIFTNEELVVVYACEYVAGRALCYRKIFMELKELRNALWNTQDTVKILCLGAGCGSELIGLITSLVTAPTTTPLHITIQDLASYGPIIPSLQSSLSTSYPSITSHTTIKTETSDLLSPSTLSWLQETIPNHNIITAMFILNELLATSKSSFVKFITTFIRSLTPGTLFLVIDSAGSFSECYIGSGARNHDDAQQKTYMVYHLLDAVRDLEILESKDSIWYRYPQGLEYGAKLNNMRYFLRLYRKR